MATLPHVPRRGGRGGVAVRSVTGGRGGRLALALEGPPARACGRAQAAAGRRRLPGGAGREHAAPREDDEPAAQSSPLPATAMLVAILARLPSLGPFQGGPDGPGSARDPRGLRARSQPPLSPARPRRLHPRAASRRAVVPLWSFVRCREGIWKLNSQQPGILLHVSLAAGARGKGDADVIGK